MSQIKRVIKTNKKSLPQAVAELQGLPSDYPNLLAEIKSRVATAQIKAALAASRELLVLYWGIGCLIVEKQKNREWGSSVIEQLAKDLRKSFPAIEGFSARNIWRMRAFFLAYPADKTSQEPSVVRQKQFLPQAVAEIPWGHHAVLLEKLKSSEERAFYAKMTIEHGWSRSVLAAQIEGRLFTRQGKAITNFKRALPAIHSDLAEQALKDPYVFDFLTLNPEMKEREFEQRLMDHVQKFLLELGVGFAFVGRQVNLEVGNQDFHVDLLFYHLSLRCFVVIELKTVPFEPEFTGKLNFYLSAVDEKFKRPEDRPSIGLLLCKSKDKLVVEYALRDVNKPIGVASWKVQLVESLPKEMRSSLPSVEQLEEEFLN